MAGKTTGSYSAPKRTSARKPKVGGGFKGNAPGTKGRMSPLPKSGKKSPVGKAPRGTKRSPMLKTRHESA